MQVPPRQSIALLLVFLCISDGKKFMIMKRIFVVSTLVLAVAAANTSCSNEFKCEKIEISEQFALKDGRTDSLDFSVTAEFPVAGLKAEAGLNISTALTEALFGEDYMTMNPDAAVKAYKEDLVEEYRAENLPMTEIEELESSSLSWAEYIHGEFTYVGEDMISYLATRYSYSGGAHGMTSEVACNFDRKTGESILEEGFFKDGYVEKLTGLLTAHLPESLESPADTSMLFLKEIEPNGNFSIGSDGITYIYNQYEIAPYSMGIIRISIPWEELEDVCPGRQ